MQKRSKIAYKTTLTKEIRFVLSITKRVGINITVITLLDVVGVCNFKVALTVYQLQIPNLDTSHYL